MPDALTNAILAMDAYNRGYDPGLLLDGATASQGKIGFAEIAGTDGGQDAMDVSFFAIAYDVDGKRVISYRGTDDFGTAGSLWTDGDIFNGWVVGGGDIGDQAIRAINFYQTMSNDLSSGQDYRLADISLTGHSLGGGLAGLVASIYGKEAMVFDNMPFEAATGNLYELADDYSVVADAVYGIGNTPWLPDGSLVDGYAVEGEALEILRLYSSFQPTALSTYGAISPLLPTNAVALHSQALLVSLLYGETLSNVNWQNAAEYFITKMSDPAIAESLGWVSGGATGQAASGDKMAAALAYSALDISSDPQNGVLVYGDTGIRSLFDDANDLGAAIVRVSGDPTGVSEAFDGETKELIGSIITNYAGALAYEGIARYGLDGDPTRVTGVLAFHDDEGGLSLNLNEDDWAFGDSPHTISAKEDLLIHLLGAVGDDGSADAALAWYAGSPYVSPSTLIQSVTFDLNGATDVVASSFLATAGLNMIMVRDAVGGARVVEPGDYFIIGGGASDQIIGGGATDILFGGDEDDELHGGGGNNYLDGGQGEDAAIYEDIPTNIDFSFSGIEIHSDEFNDELVSIELIKVSAQIVNVFVRDNILQNDTVIALSDTSEFTLDFNQSLSGVDFSISNGVGTLTDLLTEGSISISGIENLSAAFGSNFADQMNIDISGAQIYGGEGDDVILGGLGSQELNGDFGDDIISGGAGSDYLDGGLGNDNLSGGDGADVIWGGPEYDGYLDIDNLYGGSGDDIMHAGGAQSWVYGEEGDDQLYSSSSDAGVYLEGGAGNDRFFVNTIDTEIVGGEGNDAYNFDGFFQQEDGVIVNLSGSFGHDVVESGTATFDLAGYDQSDLKYVWDADVVSFDGEQYQMVGDLALVVKSTGDSILFRDVTGWRQGATTGVVKETWMAEGYIGLDDHGYFQQGNHAGQLTVDGISLIDFYFGSTASYDVLA